MPSHLAKWTEKYWKIMLLITLFEKKNITLKYMISGHFKIEPCSTIAICSFGINWNFWTNVLVRTDVCSDTLQIMPDYPVLHLLLAYTYVADHLQHPSVWYHVQRISEEQCTGKLPWNTQPENKHKQVYIMNNSYSTLFRYGHLDTPLIIVRCPVSAVAIHTNTEIETTKARNYDDEKVEITKPRWWKYGSTMMKNRNNETTMVKIRK